MTNSIEDATVSNLTKTMLTSTRFNKWKTEFNSIRKPMNKSKKNAEKRRDARERNRRKSAKEDKRNRQCYSTIKMPRKRNFNDGYSF